MWIGEHGTLSENLFEYRMLHRKELTELLPEIFADVRWEVSREIAGARSACVDGGTRSLVIPWNMVLILAG